MRSERQALAEIAALPGYVNADGSAWLDAGLVAEILADVQPEPAPAATSEKEEAAWQARDWDEVARIQDARQAAPIPGLTLDGDDLIFVSEVLKALGTWKKSINKEDE